MASPLPAHSLTNYAPTQLTMPPAPMQKETTLQHALQAPVSLAAGLPHGVAQAMATCTPPMARVFRTNEGVSYTQETGRVRWL